MPALPSNSFDRRSSIAVTHTTFGLLVALVVLFSVILICIGALLVIKHYRNHKNANVQDVLPRYTPSATALNRQSPLLFSGSDEKNRSLASIDNQSVASLPEIRIHFSEDVDETGTQRAPAKVVVVRIGAKSVGLEPTDDDEDLPPYRPLRDPRIPAMAAAAEKAEQQ